MAEIKKESTLDTFIKLISIMIDMLDKLRQEESFSIDFKMNCLEAEVGLRKIEISILEGKV